jgi:hypothetical protein
MEETDEGGAGEGVETAAEKSKTERPNDCLVMHKVELSRADLLRPQHQRAVYTTSISRTPLRLNHFIQYLTSPSVAGGRVWRPRYSTLQSNAAERNPATRSLTQQHVRLDTTLSPTWPATTTLNKTRLPRRVHLPMPTTQTTRAPRRKLCPRTGPASSAARPLHLLRSADTTTYTLSRRTQNPQTACTMSTRSGRSVEASPAGSRGTVSRILHRVGRRALRRWTIQTEVADRPTMSTAQKTTHRQARRSWREKAAVEPHLSTCRAGNPRA